ncbi:MAG: NADP-dependent oxidoreductase [Actinomycetota bacterium]|nr:MAG: NADP-dependent oxidoreductase [Actinomycetota bacterium]
MKTMEIVLSKRPIGWPAETDFTIRETELDGTRDGQVLVKTIWLSVDPYLRGRMSAVKSYIAPFELDKPISSGGIGQVVSSQYPSLNEGDFVAGNFKWREFDNIPANDLSKVDPEQAPLSAYLGVLGMPGLTAFVGLRRIGALKPSDTVFVSAAAGAVGSVAGQIAKISGATVIGSAGSVQKVNSLIAKGFDYAFNYKEQSVSQALKEFAPSGLDLYFDNVGGDHLHDSISNMANFGRIVMCGAISQYNLSAPPAGPSNLSLVVSRRLTLRGFIVSDHSDMRESFLSEAIGWLRHGKLAYDETIRIGLDQAPKAFIELLEGVNLGKMLVKVAEPV